MHTPLFDHGTCGRFLKLRYPKSSGGPLKTHHFCGDAPFFSQNTRCSGRQRIFNPNIKDRMYKKAKKVLQLGIWCRISAWHQIVGLWFVFDQEFGDRFLHFPWDSIANKKTSYILKSRWSYNLNQMGFQVSKIGLRSISTIRYVIGLHGSASKAIALVIQRRKVLETKTRIRSNTQDQDIVAAAEITPCHVLCVPNMTLSKSVFFIVHSYMGISGCWGGKKNLGRKPWKRDGHGSLLHFPQQCWEKKDGGLKCIIFLIRIALCWDMPHIWTSPYEARHLQRCLFQMIYQM